MRHLIQIPITNTTLHYLNGYEVKSRWIDQTLFIFYGINIKIGTVGSSLAPPLFLCLKVTHMIQEVLLCLVILFKDTCDKVRGIQHIGKEVSVFHILLHLLQMFFPLLKSDSSRFWRQIVGHRPQFWRILELLRYHYQNNH